MNAIITKNLQVFFGTLAWRRKMLLLAFYYHIIHKERKKWAQIVSKVQLNK